VAKKNRWMVKCVVPNREDGTDIMWLSTKAKDEKQAEFNVQTDYAVYQVLEVVPAEKYTSHNGGSMLSVRSHRPN
jgi:hypothetical protein